MQPAMVVGLISMMTGSTLQEDIALSHPAAATQGPRHPGHAFLPKPSALTRPMITKRLLCPERLRQVPPQFSWIDQRLVRDGHLGRCSPPALALYLLLVTVADAQGLSYYSDPKAARLLSLSAAELGAARRGLLQAGLIAYEPPLYQALSLEPSAGDLGPGPTPRTGQTLPLSAILRQILQSGGPPPP
jgi:hypothetical protein